MFASGGNMQKALLIDDDRTERRMVSAILRQELGLDVVEADNGRIGLQALSDEREGNIKLIILDLDMPVMGGLETLKAICKSDHQIPVIVLTGSTRTQDAVQAMKAGATDFLSKPVERERLVVSARNALKLSLLTREVSRLRRHGERSMCFEDLIGCHGGLAMCIKTARKATACNLPVLITGDTGTGKEVFANAIHGESARNGSPFVAVNCGAIPEKLVESTLFGHEKGAFTGAVEKSLGKFQEAIGGTIFLDEVGELPPEAQVKLLRVLQEREVEPVGAGRSVPVDVRIISATNRNLLKEVQGGRFREDLFFRLNVLHIDLPPLKQRKSDIPALADHFIGTFCAAHGFDIKILTPEASARLLEHGWPGNIRELENTLHRAVAMADSDVLGRDDIVLSSDALQGANTVYKTEGQTDAIQNAISIRREDGVFKNLKEIEMDAIKEILAANGNNMTKTAQILGIAKSTLYAKISHV